MPDGSSESPSIANGGLERPTRLQREEQEGCDEVGQLTSPRLASDIAAS